MRSLLVLALLLTGCEVYDDRGNLCRSGKTIWDISPDNGACWKQCAIHTRGMDDWHFCVMSGCGYQRVCK